MARPRTLILFVALTLALTACGVNGRMYPPQYERPASRTDAAKMLHTALMQGIATMTDISVTEEFMRWGEVVQPLSKVEPSPSVQVRHELLFEQLTAVTRPVELDGNWIVRLTAGGGNLTFTFSNADAAARAEAALKRLGVATPGTSR
jgi:predicted small lipoprotein YifL